MKTREMRYALNKTSIKLKMGLALLKRQHMNTIRKKTPSMRQLEMSTQKTLFTVSSRDSAI